LDRVALVMSLSKFFREYLTSGIARVQKKTLPPN
jgi:hypothetical protein